MVFRTDNMPSCSDATAKKYNPIGKIGAAILGSKESGAFQVLLYHSNDNHVCAANISPTFKFTVCQSLSGSLLSPPPPLSLLLPSRLTLFSPRISIPHVHSCYNERTPSLGERALCGRAAPTIAPADQG